jgi:hypothetical protein
MVLGCSPLNVDLSSLDPRLLLLLVSMLLNGQELHSWLGCHSPYHDHWDGLESQSVLRRWRSGDGVSRGHHVAPSVVGGFRASPSTRGGAILVGRLLEGSVQRWQPTVHHSYECGV